MSIFSRVASPFVVPDTAQSDKQSAGQRTTGGGSAFITAKVIDFISDPKILSQTQNNLIKSSVENSALLNSMPINSIWCQIIEGNRLDQHIAYPFFPAHLCMPIKPAEQVWVFYSSLDRVYYWVCRKTGDYISEDANYTHIDRIVNKPIVSASPGVTPEVSSKDAFNNTVPNTNNFPNGKSDSLYERTSGIFYNDDAILRQSQEYQQRFVQEAVPRIVRHPGDLVIQGSNNSSIVLGSTENIPGQGSVDIVAGHNLKTEPVLNTRNNKEVDKTQPASADGPIDFMADKARLYLSMFDNSDTKFSINVKGIEGSGAASSAVVVSDQVRLVARNDIKITVGDTGAGIVIKSNGEIVIVPAETSVIKLGGDDADKAILCQKIDQNQTTLGNVIAPPVISSAGGVIGSTIIEGSGLFASKILVK